MQLSSVATDAQYGYQADYAHSIKVGSLANILDFLRALRGPNGENTTFNRVGSCCPYPYKEGPNGIGLLAQWTVSYPGLAAPLVLYLNKNSYDAPQCPVGLTFKTERDVVMPILFAADSIKAVKPCGQVLYAPAGATGLPITLPPPDRNPGPVGGPEALHAYFAARTIPADEAQNMAFRVSITCLVSCQGVVGNYRISSQGRGNLETFANQVLAVVNQMPQHWQPALKDGQAVDCYQVLSFTVARGRFTQASYVALSEQKP